MIFFKKEIKNFSLLNQGIARKRLKKLSSLIYLFYYTC